MVKPTVSQCVNIFLICGVVLAYLQIIVNIIAAVDTANFVFDYESNGLDINAIKNDASSNFNSTSEWFMTISAEYEALSDFDKENVFCNVIDIQGDPLEEFVYAQYEWLMFVGFTFMSGIGATYMACTLRGCMCNKFGDGGSDVENPHNLKFSREWENWDNFRGSTGVLFVLTSAFIGLFWLLIVRRSSVTGLDCQDMFYKCGTSGDCSVDDLMLTVPLNASFFKMTISYPLLAGVFPIGFISLVWVLFTGIFLSIGVNNWSYVYLPAFMSTYGILPFLWAFFVAEYVPSVPGALGVAVLVLIPVLMHILYVCYQCYRSCKGMNF